MLISRLAQFFPNCKDYIAPIYIGRKTLPLHCHPTALGADAVLRRYQDSFFDQCLHKGINNRQKRYVLAQ